MTKMTKTAIALLACLASTFACAKDAPPSKPEPQQKAVRVVFVKKPEPQEPQQKAVKVVFVKSEYKRPLEHVCKNIVWKDAKNEETIVHYKNYTITNLDCIANGFILQEK